MLVRNIVYPDPKFKLCPVIVGELDLVGAHSQIPPKVLLIHDVRSFYHFSIQELGTLEPNQVYEALCVDKNLKTKHTHLEVKGLTHILHMPKNFQIKWIRLILSHVHY